MFLTHPPKSTIQKRTQGTLRVQGRGKRHSVGQDVLFSVSLVSKHSRMPSTVEPVRSECRSESGSVRWLGIEFLAPLAALVS